MFLRRNRRTVNGECYEYWTLVKTVRTAKGPRQEVVATLGKEPGLESRARHGWEDVADLLEGRTPAVQGQLGQALSSRPRAQWAQVDLRGVCVERVREFGQVYLALSLWRRLGLHTLLQERIVAGQEEVPWELTACILTVARFCGQRSELEVAERWYADSALEDLLGVPFSQINDARLYRGLDVLHAHKEHLCAHLLKRYQDWFGVEFEFLLYDVTSTYFEGQALGNTTQPVDTTTIRRSSSMGASRRIWRDTARTATRITPWNSSRIARSIRTSPGIIGCVTRRCTGPTLRQTAAYAAALFLLALPCPEDEVSNAIALGELTATFPASKAQWKSRTEWRNVKGPLLKGLAAFRRGEFEEAIPHLDAPENRQSHWPIVALAQYFKSLALHKLDRTAEARGLLDRANELMNQLLAVGDLDRLPNGDELFTAFAACLVARDEAETALLGHSASPPVTMERLTKHI